MFEIKIKCPYCKRDFRVGAVTISGEKYKCTHCKVWFNDKLEKIDYIKIL